MVQICKFVWLRPAVGSANCAHIHIDWFWLGVGLGLMGLYYYVLLLYIIITIVIIFTHFKPFKNGGKLDKLGLDKIALMILNRSLFFKMLYVNNSIIYIVH